MAKIDRFSLLHSIFNREKTEKIPYSLWKHFPEADKSPEGLAKAQIEFQNLFNSDLIKISPHGSYCVVDFGGILGGYRPVSGSRICARAPIMSINDWETLEPVDPNSGEFGAQTEAVKLISKKFENEIPSMMTIFSPFMVASKLDPSLLEHLFQDRNLLHDQINMLTKLTGEFAASALDAGANGLFIATQHFNADLPPSELNDFEFNPIKNILNQFTHKSTFNILHLHGDDPHFVLATELPKINAINWHDQRTRPNLTEARHDFTGGLLGGINETNLLRKGTIEEIEDSIKLVYRKFNDRGLLFAPGCVIPQDVPDKNITAVINAINSLIPI